MTCALTTLAHAKAYLGIPDTDTSSDALIGRLIQSASRFILSNIQRSTICVDEYSELYDGNGKTWMMLKQWPIIAVSAINMPGQVIAGSQLLPASQMTGQGFKINPIDSPDEGPQRVTLWGYCFPFGRDTVNVVYTAGFEQVDELVVFKAGTDPNFIYTVTLTETWVEGIEVRDALGVPMLKVASSPGIGEYAVTDAGAYTFNAAAEGNTVFIDYSYVPADLEEACYTLVAEGFRYMARIGVKSKSLGGQETVVFDNSWVTAGIDSKLNNYRRVAPI